MARQIVLPMSRNISSVQAIEWGASSTCSNWPKRCGSVSGSPTKQSMRRAGDAPLLQGFVQGVFVDDAAPRGVDQVGVGLHRRPVRFRPIRLRV